MVDIEDLLPLGDLNNEEEESKEEESKEEEEEEPSDSDSDGFDFERTRKKKEFKEEISDEISPKKTKESVKKQKKPFNKGEQGKPKSAQRETKPSLHSKPKPSSRPPTGARPKPLPGAGGASAHQSVAGQQSTKMAAEAAKIAAKTATEAAKTAATSTKAAADTVGTVGATGGTVATGTAGASSSVVAGGAGATGAAVGGTAAVASGGGLVIVIILVVLGLVIALIALWGIFFGGGQNYFSSLAGGSEKVVTRYSNGEQKSLITKLKDKMSGCDPKLVIYSEGEGEIDWQENEEGIFFHKLDTRILKTLDYLTESHRIKIGLLTTGSPSSVRENRIVGWNTDSSNEDGEENIFPEGWDSFSEKEIITFLSGLSPEEREVFYNIKTEEYKSSFTDGQAIAITEIDRSSIDELQATEFDNCGVLVAAPIKVSWQKTLSEKEIRSDWEELTYTAGILDEKIAWLQDINGRDETIAGIITIYYRDIQLGGGGSLAELFDKINRLVGILENLPSQSYYSGLHNDTKLHYSNALTGLQLLATTINIIDPYNPEEILNISREELVLILKGLSSEDSINTIIKGVRDIYKGSQVANMVGWDTGELEIRKAYESRNKIREIIAMLMAMPVRADLNEEEIINPNHFDKNLVIKQVITFSPEDDLDNGKEGLDVFPFGIEGVGIGGIAMNDSGRDGMYTYADLHFSHQPIDNGVFSKHGTNYIYNIDDENLNIVNKFLDNLVGQEWFSNALDGGIPIIPSGESGDIVKRITYQKMLHVAF